MANLEHIAGLSREELVAALIAEQVKSELRKEAQVAREALQTEIQSVNGKVGSLQADVAALKTGQTNMQVTLARMDSTLNDLSAQFGTLSRETEDVIDQTADGVEFVRKITRWRTTWDDLKRPRLWIVTGCGWLAYHLGKGFLESHGITWAGLFLKGGKL